MDSAAVKQLVGKNKIDMVYTDVPYNIDLDYNKGAFQCQAVWRKNKRCKD